MPITVTPTAMPDVLIIEPKVFGDDRGSFFESFNAKEFAEKTGLDVTFVQDNHSSSVRGVLRGLHYQVERPQGKLVHATRGEIFDVAVDIRRDSPTFGQWVGVALSAENHRQLWVPAGFAHGFVVVTEQAEVQYKTTDYWYPQHVRGLAWNDPTIAIDWRIVGAPQLAAKDVGAPFLSELR